MSNPQQSQLTEAGLEFRYRIELSWQFSNINFLGLPYVNNQQHTHLGNIYVPLTFHLSAGKVTERIPLASILEQTPLVILGDPGSGKTMLSQLLAFVFSTEGGEAWAKPFGIQRLPIVMTLREYDDIGLWKSIDDMLTAHIAKLTIACKQEVSEDLLKAMLIKGFEQGKIVLIWDGIDEIGQDTRVKLREFFKNHLAKKYMGTVNGETTDKNLIILTSRFNGYSEVSYDEFEMPTYVINGFDDSDMLRFLNKWYQARETDVEYREQEKKRITQALHNDAHLKSLASSPFLLSMIVSVARISNGLPVDKVDLYEKIFDAYLVDIQRRRGFKVFDRPKALKLWLAELAWEMCKQGLSKAHDGIFLINENDALAIPTSEGFNAKEFLDYARIFSGLLVESREGIYSFAHPSFLEYLAAWKLRSFLYDFKKLVDECKSLVIDDRFHDLLIMLFALLYEFNINNRLFEELNFIDAKHSVNLAVFFAKLVSSNDHGLNEENNKKATKFVLTQLIAFCEKQTSNHEHGLTEINKGQMTEFVLKQCCKEFDKAIVEYLSQFVQKEFFEQWFNSSDRDSDFSLANTDFLVTAFYLCPVKENLVIKISKLVDEDKAIDKTNKAYMKSSIETLYGYQNKDFFLQRADALCFFLKALSFLKQISEQRLSKINIQKELAPRLAVIAKLFADIYSVQIEMNNFRIDDTPNVADVKADKRALEMIMFNLIDNAIKYSGYSSDNKSDTTTVCQCAIKVSEENKNIVIEVEDHGIGIDQEDEESIFIEGYRSESALRCRAPGIKFIYVDLYFCRELARKMGGNLQLTHNKQPTIFKLTLPKYIG
jgi:hypothetical protein